MQAMALGELLASLVDARAVVAESFSPVLYEPRQRRLVGTMPMTASAGCAQGVRALARRRGLGVRRYGSLSDQDVPVVPPFARQAPPRSCYGRPHRSRNGPACR